MLLFYKQEVEDICGHTPLRARKWSGFICKRVPEVSKIIALGLLKEEKEERKRRRMPNRNFFIRAVRT